MKREPLGNEHDQDRWLGTMLRGSPAAPTDGCLDAETLAAWADGGLDAKASAAVELHASNCSHCTAVLATMGRTAPAVAAARAWTPTRLVRWLVPMTAAATAIAIWIAVSDRPMTPVQPAPAHDTSATSELGTRSVDPGTRNVDPGTRNLEAPPANPARRTESQEPRAELRADAPSVRQEEFQSRDEPGRERKAPEQAREIAAAAAPVEAATEAAAPPPTAAPTATAPSSLVDPPAPLATDSVSGTLTESAQSLAKSVAVSTESVSPSNPQVLWRILDARFVELSTNAGKTWTRTTPPPGAARNNTLGLTVVAVRAVDANRAVVRTSDSAEFYTTNAGRSWTRVQEKSVAPF